MACQERLLSLRLEGGCRVKLLLRSRLLRRIVLDALVEVLDLLKGQLYAALVKALSSMLRSARASS